MTPPPPAAADGPSLPLQPIEVASGRGQASYGPVDGYKATNSATGTKTDTPIRDIPQAVVVVPRQVIDDQQAVTVADVLRNVSGIQDNGTLGGRTQGFTIRASTATARPRPTGCWTIACSERSAHATSSISSASRS